MKEKPAGRQGELLFIKVNVPDWARKEIIKTGKKLNTNVIREGEISGHKHEIEGQATLLTINETYFYNPSREVGKEDFRLPEGDMFLTAENQIIVKHPEHKDKKLTKGDYVIRIQREYIEGQSRRVSD